MKRVIVIGAGPAGLMAAGQAALHGADVVLLEKMHKTGIKLSITGKGRCNITNSANLREFLNHFGEKREAYFLMQAFSRFFRNELLAFLADIGIATKEERGGRIFPVQEDAKLIRDALQSWAERAGVEIRTGCEVTGIEMEMDGRIKGVHIKGGEIVEGDRVIIAAGGLSYPGTGSTGEGFRIARRLGHTITKPLPGLVGLMSDPDLVSPLAGLSLKNVEARITSRGKAICREFGEMLFTHRGVSGPIILTISREAVDRLEKGETLYVHIDLKPALDDKTLDRRLIREFESGGKKQMGNIMKTLMPRALCNPVLWQAGIDPAASPGEVTKEMRRELIEVLKGFRLPITGHAGFTEAIVTRGGVSRKEIDPRTMESRIVPGLYFCGEVIDVDADTGGYNLQACWSTGYLAGISAAMG